MNNYSTKLNNYFNQIPNNQFILEMTKCCGYSEFMTIYKDYLLSDLYKQTHFHFGLPVQELYIFSNSSQEKIIIPNTETMTLRQFISSNTSTFVPIYPLEAKVVYKIYYNDGHHNHNLNLDLSGNSV